MFQTHAVINLPADVNNLLMSLIDVYCR